MKEYYFVPRLLKSVELNLETNLLTGSQMVEGAVIIEGQESGGYFEDLDQNWGD